MGSVMGSVAVRNNQSTARGTDRTRAVRLRESLLKAPLKQKGQRWKYPVLPDSRYRDVSSHKKSKKEEKRYQDKKVLENLLKAAMQQNTSHGLHQLLSKMSVVVNDLHGRPYTRRQRGLSQQELSSLPPIPILPAPLPGSHQSDLATPRVSPSRTVRLSDERCASAVPSYPPSLEPLPSGVKAVILSFAFYTETVRHISQSYKMLVSKHVKQFVPDYKGVQVNDAGEPDANGWYQRLDPTVARPMKGFFANNPDAWAHFIQGRPLFRKDDGYYIRYSAAVPIASHSSSSSAGSFWSLIDPEGNSLYHVKSTRKMPPEYGWRTQDVCKTRGVEIYTDMTVNIAARRHRGLDYIHEDAVIGRKSYPDEIKPWDGYFQNEDNWSVDSGCIGNQIHRKVRDVAG